MSWFGNTMTSKGTIFDMQSINRSRMDVLEEWIAGAYIFNLENFHVVTVGIFLTLHPPLHSLPPKPQGGPETTE